MNKKRRADQASSAFPAFRGGSFSFDIHGHNAGLLPFSWRLLSGFRIPWDVTLERMVRAGMGGGIVCALGDPASFRREACDPFRLVLGQMETIRGAIERTGAALALSAAELGAAAGAGLPSFLLGVEGGDFIGSEPGRLGQVHVGGVRLLGLVHYARNRLGSIALGWGGRIIPAEEQTGLTDLGREIIRRANDLGVIIDLAHADEKTLEGAAAASRAPIIVSHSGARALRDYPRYLSDNAIRRIADTGGVIGLWPFLNRGMGMADIEDFKRHAQHIRKIGGNACVAIGTDFNGVPGYMRGYANILSFPSLVRALAEAGFTDAETEAAAGGNFLRVFGAVGRAL